MIENLLLIDHPITFESKNLYIRSVINLNTSLLINEYKLFLFFDRVLMIFKHSKVNRVDFYNIFELLS